MFQALVNAFRVPELRRKIIFTLAAILFFRGLAHIAVPGANRTQLDNLFKTNGLLPLIDLFSGGGLSRFSITAMGVNPYINASIIMQLMTVVSERLKEMQKEGEYGRKKITQYTRRLTVVLGMIQAYGLILLFTNVKVLDKPNLFTIITVIATLTAGTIIMMYVGELITEYGIGNGISLVIFAGIVGRFGPSIISGIGGNAIPIGGLILFAVLALLVTMFIIYVQQAERRIRIQSAQRMVGRKVYQGRTSHLPLKVNQAGVIPIIFAISIMFFPTIIGNFFANNSGFMGKVSTAISRYWQPTGPNFTWDLVYNLIYFFLIIGFTYFYTAVTFDPIDTADNLKKQSIFIPGIRPGRSTAEYLDRVMTRITGAGALFLAIITVVIPLVAGQLAFGQAASRNSNNGVLYLGGTAVLIVVGVALDTMKQLETQLLMRQYKGFIK
ncbi:MAG TPA: preprotein translocase subunit SecY [Candidatus Dormibacteraeota bacterium]|nr:preprotein translocase subunit SecY [Candidatus Dormibacteraeota bacterium]